MKRALIGLFVVCCGLGSAATAVAQANSPAREFKGFIQVRPDRSLYAEYTPPSTSGAPTVVLLNGLTYSLRQFDSFAQALTRRGIGVARFDFDGMGQSLLRYAPSRNPYPVEQQIRDVRVVMTSLGLRPPYNLVGLSYGGGIELGYALAYPREVRNMILIAPYTEPLEGQDIWIRTQVQVTRASFPGNPASDDELYDYFLRQTIYTTYPMSEPIVLENPYKLEAVFNLVRGIRKFRPVDLAGHLPPGTVHLVTAVMDQYIPPNVLEKFWRSVNPAAKMSRLKVYQSEHKIPEKHPEFMAAWVLEILKGNPLIRGGRDFEAFPLTMTVRSGSTQFQLPR